MGSVEIRQNTAGPVAILHLENAPRTVPMELAEAVFLCSVPPDPVVLAMESVETLRRLVKWVVSPNLDRAFQSPRLRQQRLRLQEQVILVRDLTFHTDLC